MGSDDPTPVLSRFDSYEAACCEFRRRLPDSFSVTEAFSRHADATTRIALTEFRPAGANTYTFGGLNFLADKLATALGSHSVSAGDRVVVVLPQSAAFAVACLGLLKLGAVVLPIPIDADSALVNHAITDSSAKALIVDSSVSFAPDTVASAPSSLKIILVASDDVHSYDPPVGSVNFWREINAAPSDFLAVTSSPGSEAFTFYTSSRTGQIAALTHNHWSLLGNLPGFEMSCGLEFGEDPVFWTASQWASARVLLGFIYPAWYYGGSVLAFNPEPGDAEGSLRMLEAYGVTHALLPPDALLAIRRFERSPRRRFDLRLRALITEGASLTQEVIAWVNAEIGASVSGWYATDAAGILAAGCDPWFGPKPNCVGKPPPGRCVEAVDDDGRVLSSSEVGRIAVRKPDPSLACGRGEPAVPGSVQPEWFFTGDVGFKDDEGYLYLRSSSREGEWFEGPQA
jgi:acetyl-CoA synthetase